MSDREPSERRPLRLEDWPGVDERALPEPRRILFRKRSQAVALYASGQPLDDIERASAVHRATLRRLIARALRPHPDGRLWGYRALVPNERVQPYERTAAPRLLVDGKAGNAGAFAQLLQRHPSLGKQMRSGSPAGASIFSQVASAAVWLASRLRSTAFTEPAVSWDLARAITR